MWLQENFAVSESLLLQTSLSADCLLQPPTSLAGSGQLPKCPHGQPPASPQIKAPHQQPSVMLDGETDENRPPLPFNVSNMPASLTEQVRQQAKTRVSRVRVVRKAAANTSSMHTASLDFDRSSQQLHEPARAALKPKGTTSAFQLSWPPPAAMASMVGLAQINDFPLSFTGELCRPQFFLSKRQCPQKRHHPLPMNSPEQLITVGLICFQLLKKQHDQPAMLKTV